VNALGSYPRWSQFESESGYVSELEAWQVILEFVDEIASSALDNWLFWVDLDISPSALEMVAMSCMK
jgi:hypothetical protein